MSGVAAFVNSVVAVEVKLGGKVFTLDVVTVTFSTTKTFKAEHRS